MSEKTKYSLFVAIAGALFFIPFLGGVHLFDWDEINFAEIAREMIVTGEYLQVQVNYLPFWEKPPLFMWMQAIAMNIFGVGEFGARLPNAICGIVTLLVLLNMGEKLYDIKFGLIWAMAYLGSILPHLYFRSGIIDPWFNLFIFIGLYYFILFYWRKDERLGIYLPLHKNRYLLYSALFIGLAILTKGQVAFMILCMVFFVYWILQRFRMFISVGQFLLYSIMVLGVVLLWFGIETIANGPWFIITFIEYQYRLFSTPDAGHGGFIGYHFVVLLIGCFPISVFALHEMFRPSLGADHQNDFRKWSLILFWVVLILFSIVKSKIVHYSSLAYFPMTFLGALTIYYLVEFKRMMIGKWALGLLIFIGSIFSFAVIALPFVGMNIDVLIPLLEKDPFAVANLQADLSFSYWQIIPGILLLMTLIGFMYLLKTMKTMSAFKVLFIGTAIFITTTLWADIKKIEGISQEAAIRFFKGLEDKDCYVLTKGYRSYAHLFYSKKPPVENDLSYNEDWLFHGDIDKDVYLSTKITKVHEVEALGTFEKLYEENGFVFYKRSAQK